MRSRELATHLYRRRIQLFDLLNQNVLFRDFVRLNMSGCPRLTTRFSMYDYLEESILQHHAIDYIELGVWKGESILRWSTINRHPGSRFFGLDSFEGLPEHWTESSKVGAFTTNGECPSVTDKRVTFLKGLFQETLRPFLKTFQPQNRVVVHIDCDLYSSTLFGLACLDLFLVPGCLVIFDEFYDLRNEFAAWCDYSQAFYRKAKGLAFTPQFGQVALEII